MVSRRTFLLGLGSLVTSAFAARAKAHALAEGPCCLTPAAQKRPCTCSACLTGWRAS
jgi:hypothetical protein